jgi:hypothetical protein
MVVLAAAAESKEGESDANEPAVVGPWSEVEVAAVAPA